MTRAAHFRVDPRLASLLGENYRSTEQALKELIDNAWDADAEAVWISLPEAMTDGQIVVQDNGSGMTEREVRAEYLNIASDRRTRKGDRTPGKNRLVKGRKGIGKFAGLVAANIMELDTRARGVHTTVRIAKSDLIEAARDLETIKLPLFTAKCSAIDHGTTIALSSLNDSLEFPTTRNLREILVLEYGRQTDFAIYVNNEQLRHDDIPGQQFVSQTTLPQAGPVRMSLTIMETPTARRQAGIVIRVGGKVVGKQTFMGLDDDPEVPKRALCQVVGEIEADALEGDVTADWGAVILNSKGYKDIVEWARPQIKEKVAEVFAREVSELRARKEREIEQRLARLPEYRREAAKRRVNRILERFYGESEERIDTIVNFALDAMEKDEYWLVCQKIEAARQVDVMAFAESLERFGLLELSMMAENATKRLEFLDYLDELAQNPETLEKHMHKALETCLWVFGPSYSLMLSNQTLGRRVETYLDGKFRAPSAKKRPDLLLNQNIENKYLLIEFKKPSDPVGRDAEAQARKYRDDLTPYYSPMDIVVVGGKVDSSMSTPYADTTLTFLSYDAIISNARTQLKWLLSELPRATAIDG